MTFDKFCVVAPLLHSQEAPADAVSTTVPPEQNVVGPFAVTAAAGTGFTTTPVPDEVVDQPFVVTVTL